MQLPTLEKLTLGYKFDQDREIVSLIIFSYFYIILFTLVVTLLHTSGEELLPVSYRYHALILLGLVELLLIRNRFFVLAKVLILTLTPFLLLLLPPLTGLSCNEFYFWFPYIPIALSLIPHFILHTSRERTLLISTCFAYFLLSIFIDDYLLMVKDGSETIIPIILEIKFYYSLIPVIIYIFINLALGLVFARNYSYEQIMIKQQDELLQAEKMAALGTLTSGIAHEINNPLNFISGGLYATNTLKNELIKTEGHLTAYKRTLYEQMDKIMENSLEGVDRVSDIIASLKYFSNPGREIKMNHDLEQLLFSVLLSIEKKIPYNITLSKKIPVGTSLFCYDKQVQQVFSNILLNAIDALKEMEGNKNKRIHIAAKKAKRDKSEVTCISFSNNGPLIPEQEIKKIYDPFFTLNDKGKGLGMTISYMIIREQQGWIEARNENDLVIFDVILPAG
jgi:signal transduction histidine kinase